MLVGGLSLKLYNSLNVKLSQKLKLVIKAPLGGQLSQKWSRDSLTSLISFAFFREGVYHLLYNKVNSSRVVIGS